MLRPRIIPCLLVRNKGLVKTVKFKDSKYVGDPLNAVKIFNEKESDELIVLDIDATSKSEEPDYRLIENLASECRMPLCYGGGIRTLEQAKRILGLGVEKVAISSAFLENLELASEIASQVGNQSVVAVIDVKKRFLRSSYEVRTHNATIGTGKSPVEWAQLLEKAGVGEIVINSIDNDGLMQGYDLKFIDQIRDAISVPLTVLGGAGSLSDIKHLIDKYKIIGAAAGSLFVFKGKYRAVLINYPNPVEKTKLILDSMKETTH